MNRSNFLFAVLLCLTCLLIPSARLSAHQPGFTDTFMFDRCDFASRGENPYFILEPGYQLVFEGEEEKAFVRLEITVLFETKMIAGVKTRVVEEVEYADNELVEISRNYFAICKQTNSVAYFGEDVDIYEDGEIVSHEGGWMAGEDGAEPGLMMPGTPLLGARFYQEIAPDVALDRAEILSLSEVLETPAGTFVDVLLTEETTPLEPNAKDFKRYAPDIGLIQDGPLKLVFYSPGF